MLNDIYKLFIIEQEQHSLEILCPERDGKLPLRHHGPVERVLELSQDSKLVLDQGMKSINK